MRGMDAETGKPIEGEAHLRQSIGDILTTPVGTRVARRDYGSELPRLLAQPMNAAGRLRLFAATAIAIARWEPRFRLRAVALAATAAGAFTLDLDGDRLDIPGGPRRTRLNVPVPRSA
ncbi:MAG: GPW/gp25 family protein [Allosphingosinicella sp.]|uniref:GPW/gp25 family protein n=1 Tax=Allosphingosinicella sp. TaxID=2823234 RepID=UPI0039316296